MMKRLPTMRLLCLLACVAFASLALPQTALADNSDIDTCSTNLGGYTPTSVDITSKIVYCLTGLMYSAAISSPNSLLSITSGAMVDIAGAVGVIAIAIMGMRILGGEDQMVKTAGKFFLRFAIVFYCLWHIGDIAAAVVNTEDELLALVGGGYTPWQKFDYYLGQLLGIGWDAVPVSGSGSALKQGLAGLLGGALLSSSTGMFLALAGFSAILEFFFLIFRTIYIYIQSLCVIMLMLAVSPFIIPMALFSSQEKYVKTLYSVIISAMMIPAMLFALLNVFMKVFNTIAGGGAQSIIGLIFQMLGSPTGLSEMAKFDQFEKDDTPLYSWGIASDPSFMARLQTGQHDYSSIPPPMMPGNINPRMAHAIGYSINVPTVSFGAEDAPFVIALVMCFIELWLLASLLKSLVEQVPHICYDITGAALNINTGATDLETTVKTKLHTNDPEGLRNFANNLSERLRPGSTRKSATQTLTDRQSQMPGQRKDGVVPITPLNVNAPPAGGRSNSRFVFPIIANALGGGQSTFSKLNTAATQNFSPTGMSGVNSVPSVSHRIPE